MCVGGEEKSGLPGELAVGVCTRRRLGGGEIMSSVLVDCGGEVMSDVWKVAGGGPPAELRRKREEERGKALLSNVESY